MKLEAKDKAILTKLIKPIVLVFGFPVLIMILWNWLFVPIFELPIVSYWQAFGLYVLIHITFNPFNLWQTKK